MEQRVWLVEKPRGDFQQVELPRPALAKDQVLVRISASTVNPLDIKIRQGSALHAQQPLPAVLGLDMAGTVEEVGRSVTAFSPGDEVYGMVGGVGGLQGTLAHPPSLNYWCRPTASWRDTRPGRQADTASQSATLFNYGDPCRACSG
jgi:NADPH:quinone reductase-like Zn-dependent oxidoreductase